MSDQIDLEPAVGLLSSREQEILEQVAMGELAKQVARSLVISPRTVERHVENIRQEEAGTKHAALDYPRIFNRSLEASLR